MPGRAPDPAQQLAASSFLVCLCADKGWVYPLHSSMTMVCPEPPVNMQGSITPSSSASVAAGMGGRVEWKGQFLGQQKFLQEVTHGSIPRRVSSEKKQMHLAVSRAAGWGWHCPGVFPRTPVTNRQIIPEAPLGTELAPTPTDGPSWLSETPFLVLHVVSTSTLLCPLCTLWLLGAQGPLHR